MRLLVLLRYENKPMSETERSGLLQRAGRLDNTKQTSSAATL